MCHYSTPHGKERTNLGRPPTAYGLRNQRNPNHSQSNRQGSREVSRLLEKAVDAQTGRVHHSLHVRSFHSCSGSPAVIMLPWKFTGRLPWLPMTGGSVPHTDTASSTLRAPMPHISPLPHPLQHSLYTIHGTALFSGHAARCTPTHRFLGFLPAVQNPPAHVHLQAYGSLSQVDSHVLFFP